MEVNNNKLESRIRDLEYQIPSSDQTLNQRFETIEYEVFGSTGIKREFNNNRRIFERIVRLENNLYGAAGWLKLDEASCKFTGDKTELENIRFCIRSAAYHSKRKKNHTWLSLLG